MHRSPDPGAARRTNVYGSPPSGSAPQPSQHLRAAAHTTGRRLPAPSTTKPGGYADAAADRPPSSLAPADTARYQEEYPALGGTGGRSLHPGKGHYADALTGQHHLSEQQQPHSKDASAAVLAAVAGLKPSPTAPPPPRSTAPHNKPARKQAPEGGGDRGPYPGPQLPSPEATNAAVLAALGSGPGGPGLSHSGSGVDQDAVEQHAQDSKLGGGSSADLQSEGLAGQRKLGGGGVEGGNPTAAPAAAAAAPARRIAATGLFSNVIGQLRRQSNARDSSDTQEGDEGV